MSAHSWFDFAIITASVALTMLACRDSGVALKAAPAIQWAACSTSSPPAAFAALVANDLSVLDGRKGPRWR